MRASGPAVIKPVPHCLQSVFMTLLNALPSNLRMQCQAALARLLAERRARMQAAIPAGPRDDPPSYEAIDARPHNRLFMHMFRQSVVDGLGEDAPEPGCVLHWLISELHGSCRHIFYCSAMPRL
jgi:hypothetical protein